MQSLPHSDQDLSRIYEQRFARNLDYRRRVWRILIDNFFSRYLTPSCNVLDLGCGYGEFINQVTASRKHGMDLNPDAPHFLSDNVNFIRQDCSQPWPIPERSLDVVFTSNFFEHLPDKAALGRTLDNIRAALAPGGLLIALGPNVKHVPGSYWDFWDHYVPLTELSLGEALENRGFALLEQRAKFLPYTMARGPEVPVALVNLYLKLPILWPIFGKQFLVVAKSAGVPGQT